MNPEIWKKHFAEAYKAAGENFSKSIEEFLLFDLPEKRTEEMIQKSLKAKDIIQAHVFQKAVVGETFGDVGRIREKFGSPIEDNYGLRTGPFINVAKAYWTFKIEIDDLNPEYTNKFITQILLLAEREIAAIFFPTPGPVAISVKKRREAQRETLQEYAPQIDIERFLEESPILKADLHAQGDGCLSIIIASILIPIAVIVVFSCLSWVPFIAFLGR